VKTQEQLTEVDDGGKNDQPVVLGEAEQMALKMDEQRIAPMEKVLKKTGAEVLAKDVVVMPEALRLRSTE
jgi:hypothetical protein